MVISASATGSWEKNVHFEGTEGKSSLRESENSDRCSRSTRLKSAPVLASDEVVLFHIIP